MKHIRKFNEDNQDKLSIFHREYEELCSNDELGNHELWTEIGQLTLKYNLTKDDVLYVLNNFNCKFDINKLLKQTWSDWEDNLDVNDLWNEVLNIISEHSIPRDHNKVLNILKNKYNINKILL
jgi:hypothetical protein